MFHRWIEKELAQIREGDLVDPEYEMDPKTDHLVGEMSEELKKLFTLWRKTAEATKTAKKAFAGSVKKILLEFPEEPVLTDVLEAEKKMEQLKRSVALAELREDAMRGAFWVSVRDEFPEAKEKTLTVCKGFKVAWIEREVGPKDQIIEVVVMDKA
ncbi:hypothetical protein AMJ48_02335 [Parcubacteria bacterium DG_74_1]|nr:MAG: hypothetical protein AMJ48_02335 [Parcubacteria bacterium DG_74_1]